ncbi:acyltransferase family protein [Yoonia maritima]|uniref:acyltransferase family protein n=1 Tax=Yoonia maritima TaxID=1435347 RepID=UPI0013FD8AD3|nr:acyltransferase family protein [Yoonia maritima]
MQYRHDIDGLRALAVLLIIFFHAELASVPGGFIGVDVFFVISGYLITALIQREIAGGRFSYAAFYIRRVRRLAPAMLCTLTATLVAGWFILPPAMYKEAAQSALTTVMSVSNIFFWWDTGYFSSEAYSKPLLHTWSLGVEEQFYLLWPAAFILCLRTFSRNGLIGALLIMSASSLLAAQMTLGASPSASFFLTPFRIYEFSAGALLAFCGAQARHQLTSNLVAAAGVAAIFYASVTFTSETDFPGITALVPVLGTVFLIYAGPQTGMNRAFSLAPIRYIGRISYSLYLVHWPVQVYYRLLFGRPESSSEIMVVLLISVGLGAIMYHFVENPFRKKRSGDFIWSAKALGVAAIISATAICIVSIIIQSSHGVPSRFPLYTTSLLGDLNTAIIERHKGVRDWTCNATTGSAESYFSNFDDCNPSSETSVVVILGDSHAADIYMGMRTAFPNLPIVQLTGNGCHLGKNTQENSFCAPFFSHWRNWLEENKSRIAAIVYSQSGGSLLQHRAGGIERPNSHILQQLISNLDDFVPDAVDLFFWGPRVGFNPTIDIAIMRSPDPETLRQYYHLSDFQSDLRLDQWLDNQFADNTATYTSSIRTLCDPYCPSITPENDLYVIDYAHWSPEGARNAVISLTAASPELAAIIEHLSLDLPKTH